MKFYKRLLTVVLLFAFLFSSFVVSASTGEAEYDASLEVGSFENDATVIIYLDDDFYIEKTADGRVMPLNPDILSVKQLDAVLKEIGFSEEEIATFEIEAKKEFSRHGGRKVELRRAESVVKIYNDDGELVENVDLLDSDYELQVTQPNFTQVVVYHGQKPNGDMIYMYTIIYRWTDQPYFDYTDSFAMAWQNLVAYGGTRGYYSRYKYGSNTYEAWNSYKQELEGASMNFDLKLLADEQWGLITNEVHVHRSLSGSTGNLLWKYGHSLTAIPLYVNIYFLSIDLVGGSRIEWQDIHVFDFETI